MQCSYREFCFQIAVTRFPETMQEALDKEGKTIQEVDVFIPHQPNLRIAQFVQQKFGLPDEKSIIISRNMEIQLLLLFLSPYMKRLSWKKSNEGIPYFSLLSEMDPPG